MYGTDEVVGNSGVPCCGGVTPLATPTQLQNQASGISNALRRLKESVEIRDVDDEEYVISSDLSLAVGNVEPANDKNLLLAKTELQTQNFSTTLIYEYKSRRSPTVVDSLSHFINKAVSLHQIADPNFMVRLI